MKIALVCAAGLLLLATAGVRAETVFVADIGPSAAESAPIYAEPAPAIRRYRVIESDETVVAHDPHYVVREPGYLVRERSYVVREPGYVVRDPDYVVVPRPPVAVGPSDGTVVVERRGEWAPEPRVYGRRVIDTDYASPRSCWIDSEGFRRCY